MMNGASTACQSPGSPGGFGGGLSGRLRLAIEYRVRSSVDSKPVLGSIRRILMPVQKLPNDNHALPFSSRTRFGSMALKSSSARDRNTSPRSDQWKSELFGFSVLFVRSAIPDVFLPKAEKA